MAPDGPRDRRLMADIAAERPAPLSPQSWCSSAVDCMGMGRVLQAGATDRPGTRMTGIHPTHAGVADGAGGIVEGLMKKVVLASVIGALGAPALALPQAAPVGADAASAEPLSGFEGGAGGEDRRPIDDGAAFFLHVDHDYAPYYGGYHEGGEGGEGGEGHYAPYYGGYYEGGEGGEGGEGHYRLHTQPYFYPHPTASIHIRPGAGGPNATAGAIIGGVAGGVLGSQIGSGSGQFIATGVGTLIGAILGINIGASLERTDAAYVLEAERQAYATPVGDTIHWYNPGNDHRGSITATAEGRHTQTGQYCREYSTSVTVGGGTQTGVGVACLMPDGRWQIVR